MGKDKKTRAIRFGSQPVGEWGHEAVLKNLHMFNFSDTTKVTVEGVAYLWFLGPALDYVFFHCPEVIAEAFSRRVNEELMRDARKLKKIPECFPKDPIGNVEAFDPPLVFSPDYVRVLKYCRNRKLEKLFCFLRRREVFIEDVSMYFSCKWLASKEEHENFAHQAVMYYKTCGVMPDKKMGVTTMTYHISALEFLGKEAAPIQGETPSDGGETSGDEAEADKRSTRSGSLEVPGTGENSEGSGNELKDPPDLGELSLPCSRSETPSSSRPSSVRPKTPVSIDDEPIYEQLLYLNRQIRKFDDVIENLSSQIGKTFSDYEGNLDKITQQVGVIKGEISGICSKMGAYPGAAEVFQDEPILAVIHSKICTLKHSILCLEFTSPIKLVRVLEKECRVPIQEFLDLDDASFIAEVTSAWNTSVLRYLNTTTLYDRELVSIPRVNSVDYVENRITSAINNNPTLVQLNRDVVELQHLLKKTRSGIASTFIPSAPGIFGVTPKEPIQREEALLGGYQSYIKEVETKLPQPGLSKSKSRVETTPDQNDFTAEVLSSWKGGSSRL